MRRSSDLTQALSPVRRARAKLRRSPGLRFAGNGLLVDGCWRAPFEQPIGDGNRWRLSSLYLLRSDLRMRGCYSWSNEHVSLLPQPPDAGAAAGLTATNCIASSSTYDAGRRPLPEQRTRNPRILRGGRPPEQRTRISSPLETFARLRAIKVVWFGIHRVLRNGSGERSQTELLRTAVAANVSALQATVRRKRAIVVEIFLLSAAELAVA